MPHSSPMNWIILMMFVYKALMTTVMMMFLTSPASLNKVSTVNKHSFAMSW